MIKTNYGEIRWTGHVSDMVETRSAYKILVAKPKQTTSETIYNIIYQYYIVLELG